MGRRLEPQLLIGTTFGHWLVFDTAEPDARNKTQVACRCTGCNEQTERVVRLNDLRSGRSRSCGCRRVSGLRQATTKHGDAPRDARSRTFRRWKDLRARYRGRYVQEWDDFTVFLQDMGHLPLGYVMRVVDRSIPVMRANLVYAPKKSSDRRNVARDMRRAEARGEGRQPE